MEIHQYLEQRWDKLSPGTKATFSKTDDKTFLFMLWQIQFWRAKALNEPLP
jgi:hypothetical protein